MAPYLDCISQGVSTVMATFSSWNGQKVHGEHHLLTEILKEKLGFKVHTTNSVNCSLVDKFLNPQIVTTLSNIILSVLKFIVIATESNIISSYSTGLHCYIPEEL